MIVAIGNAPSSGSTFLADILDSLPFAVCGPEISLFAVKPIFRNFSNLKVKKATASSGLIYQSRQRILFERLCAYGIEHKLLDTIIDESNDFSTFCNAIFSVFSAIRGKECLFYFEKTPQNIHCADEFLETFSDGFFIHIVRNPIYVYKSLKKRGFPEYIAMHTWLADVSKAYSLRNHERFFTIKYEDLVNSPYKQVISLLNRMGSDFDCSELERLYLNNRYRKTVSQKIKSWSINKYGKPGNANFKQIEPEDLVLLSVMMQTMLNKKYCAQFGIEPVSFETLIRYYGYNFNHMVFDNYANNKKNTPDLHSIRQLFKKYMLDVYYGDTSINNLLTYLKPVNICAE